jgi:hypothetical protein
MSDTQMAVQEELAHVIKSGLAGPRTFATGSKGFFGTDKITVDGARYQAQAMAVLIKSKGTKVKVLGTLDQAQAALTALVESGMPAKAFSTGNAGFRTQGKIEIGGQQYQASAQAILLKK